MIGSPGKSSGGFIQVNISGIEKIQQKLEALGPEAGAFATEIATNYLLNVIENKEIPESKSVFRGSRTMAYGKPFFTQKQRRFFFAALRSGEIVLPYRRGGKLSGTASKWKTTGSGLSYRIYNTSRAAYYLYDNNYQARQLGLAGWKKIGMIITEYMPQIVRSFSNAVHTWIKKAGLS